MAVLGQCPSLSRLGLGKNGIGDEGAGRVAEVLGQCPSLAHLDPVYNDIGGDGAASGSRSVVDFWRYIFGRV